MIFLTPHRQPEKTLEEFKDEFKAEGLTEADLPAVVNQFEEIYLAGTKGNASFRVGYALDEDGREYRDVTVYYNARFTRDGVRWVSAGDIALNFDALLDIVREGVSA